MVKQNPVLNIASTSQPGANSVENFSTGLQGPGSTKNHFNNTSGKSKKGEYRESQAVAQQHFKEAQNIVIKNGPFETTKILDKDKNEAMLIEKEE